MLICLGRGIKTEYLGPKMALGWRLVPFNRPKYARAIPGPKTGSTFNTTITITRVMWISRLKNIMHGAVKISRRLIVIFNFLFYDTVHPYYFTIRYDKWQNKRRRYIIVHNYTILYSTHKSTKLKLKLRYTLFLKSNILKTNQFTANTVHQHDRHFYLTRIVDIQRRQLIFKVGCPFRDMRVQI